MAAGAGVGVGDLAPAGFASLESVGAERGEAFLAGGLFLLIDGDGDVAIGVVDGDGDVGGAVGESAVGDGDLIASGFGQDRDEAGFLLAFGGVALMAVALLDEAGGGGRWTRNR